MSDTDSVKYPKAMLNDWIFQDKRCNIIVRSINNINNNVMERKDLGSKKMNNKQNVNEGFSGDNMSAMHNPSGPILKPDVEIDLNGNPIIVQRARDLDTTPVHIPEPPHHHWTENESMNRDLSEGEVKRTVENKDRNSDITANRYPNSNPENRENRGNMKLDE